MSYANTSLQISHELPFTDNSPFFFEEDTLMFTLFVSNPFINHKSILQALHKRLNEYFRPWVHYYPWLSHSLDLKLIENYKGKVSYIYGALIYGNSSNDDEWMVLQLVLEVLKGAHQDVIVHFFDQDGEFILSEDPDLIPKWCEPETTFNRVWFNSQGELLLIPPESNGFLNLWDALKFFNTRVYKLDNFSFKALNKKVQATRFQPISLYLERIKLVDVAIPRNLADVIANSITSTNLNVVGKSLNSYITDNIILRIGSHSMNSNFKFDKGMVSLKVPMHFAHYTVLKEYLHSASSEDMGKSLQDGFLSLNDPDIMSFAKAVEQVNINNFNNFMSSDPLQMSLMKSGILSDKVRSIDEEQFDLELKEFENSPGISESDKSNLESQMKEIFQETERELKKELDDHEEKIVYKDDDEFYDDDDEFKDEKGDNKGNDKIDNGNNNYNLIIDIDDNDTNETNDDEEILKYFEKQNVSISEDDFFEFFLLNALNVPAEKLKEYANNRELEVEDESNFNDDENQKTALSDSESSDGEIVQEFNDLRMTRLEVEKLAETLKRLSPA